MLSVLFRTTVCPGWLCCTSCCQSRQPWWQSEWFCLLALLLCSGNLHSSALTKRCTNDGSVVATKNYHTGSLQEFSSWPNHLRWKWSKKREFGQLRINVSYLAWVVPYNHNDKSGLQWESWRLLEGQKQALVQLVPLPLGKCPLAPSPIPYRDTADPPVYFHPHIFKLLWGFRKKLVCFFISIIQVWILPSLVFQAIYYRQYMLSNIYNLNSILYFYYIGVSSISWDECIKNSAYGQAFGLMGKTELGTSLLPVECLARDCAILGGSRQTHWIVEPLTPILLPAKAQPAPSCSGEQESDPADGNSSKQAKNIL